MFLALFTLLFFTPLAATVGKTTKLGSLDAFNLSYFNSTSNEKVLVDYDDEYSIDSLVKHQYYISGWLSLFVAIFGIIGNILNITILLKKTMRNPTNTFITGLSISDLISLILVIILVSLRYILITKNKFHYYEFHTYTYPYLYPLAATFQFASIYLIIATMLSRVITLYLPIVNEQFNTVPNCHKIILLILVFSSSSCFPLWFYYKVDYVREEDFTMIYLGHTQVSLNHSYRFYFHIYIVVLTYVIPLIILSILNYFLVVFIYRSRKRKHRLGLMERNEMMITVILILFVFLFCICQLPNFFLHFCEAANIQFSNAVARHYFQQWSNFLLILNSSYSFMIYCALSEEFREEAKKIFLCYRTTSYIDIYRKYKFKNKRRGGANLLGVQYNTANEEIDIVQMAFIDL